MFLIEFEILRKYETGKIMLYVVLNMLDIITELVVLNNAILFVIELHLVFKY